MILQVIADSDFDNGEAVTTPLYAACESGDHHAVARTLLFTYGVDVNHASDRRTPLWVASALGYEATVAVCLQHPEVDLNYRATDEECSALFAASSRGHLGVVDLLLRAHADPNLPDVHGRTALFGACHSGSLRVLGLLLRHGVDAGSSAGAGCPPLVIASAMGRAEVVTMMLFDYAATEVDVNEGIESSGCTALVIASQEGHSDIVEILLRHPALDVNQPQTNTGASALVMAAVGGHAQVVQQLITSGALLDAPDSYGKTALSRAHEEGHDSIVDLLVLAGAAEQVE